MGEARVLPQSEKGHTTTSAVSTHRKWATGSAHPLGLGPWTRALQQVASGGAGAGAEQSEESLLGLSRRKTARWPHMETLDAAGNRISGLRG